MIFQDICEQQRIEKNGLGDYGSGIGIQKPKLDLNSNSGKSKLKSNEQLCPPKCKACGSSSHRRRSHHNCPFYEKKMKEKKYFRLLKRMSRKNRKMKLTFFIN